MQAKIIASFTYPHYANRGKVRKILEVLREYRKTAELIAKDQWKIFFMTGRFSKHAKLRHIQSNLSERYKQVCLWQVVSILESYTSSIASKIREIILSSTIPEERKRALLYINSIKGWFLKEPPKEWISVEDLKLARRIFRHVLGIWRRPSFRNISMHLDQKVAMLEENRKSKSFDYWLKLSTLEKGRPIYIPLKVNSYAESLEGKLLNFCQIVEEKGKVSVRLVKELESKRDSYIPAVESIAIDLGLRPLIAIDRGDLLGRQFFDFLSEYDRKITKRLSSLQKRGIRPSTDRKYRELVRKLREFLKNEINRHINRLVEIYKPKRIVVEKLDFRSPELSKRMNRLIQNFGKRFVREKLKRLEELYGIKVVEVNPAYSSQECSSCGYVDKKNRKDTQSFECGLCGRKINAQVNSAKNILRRASLLGVFKPATAKKQVLRVLVKRHLERLKGCDSAVLEVLKNNPYYRDFLNPCSGGNRFL